MERGNDTLTLENAAYANTSSGWIQWKGTDVCMDFHCLCGFHGHIDGGYWYYIQCAGCKTIYRIGQSVTLHPVPPAQPMNMDEVLKPGEDGDYETDYASQVGHK